MIILIDNYDSFTYNLYQFVRELTTEPVQVIRNDEASVADILGAKPQKIIISPGPGRPEGAGICLDLVRQLPHNIPLLGVCLGHQILAVAYGATIRQATNIVHGKVEKIELDGRGLFRTIGTSAQCARYHSLAVDEQTLSSEFVVTARATDGEIMGIRHTRRILEGVQFHPESLGTPDGKMMLRNFLNYRRHSFSVSTYIERIQNGTDLTQSESARFMDELTNGDLTDTQMAAMLVALNAKGVTSAELVGCAKVLLAKRTTFHASGTLVDTCGTGGDGLGTHNISSLAAILTAACGVPVAKHGNRAVSSRSGSADFYQSLGLPLNMTPHHAERLLETCGFAFLFAPMYHQAVKYAVPVRRSLGIKTIFNLLGPLVNPARPTHQLIGVYNKQFAERMAQAAHLLGTQRVFVVYADDGQDEISVSSPSTLVIVEGDGSTRTERINPHDYGIRQYPLDDLIGGAPQENARLSLDVLSGNSAHHALRDAVIVNCAGALLLTAATATFEEAITMATDTLSSGAAAQKWEHIVKTARRIQQEKNTSS